MEGRMKVKPAPLKINKESRMIRKPPVPLPIVQYRQPVIIHTYSPKVIETDATNFMWLVQRLTGSSDTRLRCKNCKPAVVPGPMPSSPTADSASDPPEDDGKSNNRSNNSSSSSDDSSFLQWKEEQHDQDPFKVEQMLLSPTSSTDSGLCGRFGKLCPLTASPKSPLFGYDNLFLQQEQQQPQYAPDEEQQQFVASGCSSESVYVPSLQPLQGSGITLPWSPIPTPNGMSRELFSELPIFGHDNSFDAFFPLADLQAGSSYGRLFGPLASPATMAYRDVALAYIKEPGL